MAKYSCKESISVDVLADIRFTFLLIYIYIFFKGVGGGFELKCRVSTVNSVLPVHCSTIKFVLLIKSTMLLSLGCCQLSLIMSLISC